MRLIKTMFVILFLLSGGDALAQEAQVQNGMEEIKPGIYRTQHGTHYGVVVEGEKSLLVFDTLSADFSRWLDGELKSRFPEKPVKYVVYSHNHADHVSGGEVFESQNPIYISHILAKLGMQRMQVPTRYPSVTFDDTLHIDLDGQNIEFKYWGPNDGKGSISLYIPEQKFIAVMDWALTDRVAYKNLSRYNIDGMIGSLHEIDRLDWDLISPGHAGTGTKQQVQNFRSYLETMRDTVIDGINAGDSKDRIITDAMTVLRSKPEFTNLKMFDEWALMNVTGVYDQIAAVEGVATE